MSPFRHLPRRIFAREAGALARWSFLYPDFQQPGPARPRELAAFRIEAGEAKILIDPFLSDNPSRDNGWSGYLTGKNSTQGGDR